MCFVQKSGRIHMNWNSLLAKINKLLGKSKHKKAAKFAAVILTTHVESLVPIGQSKYEARLKLSRISISTCAHSARSDTENFGVPIMPTANLKNLQTYQFSPCLDFLASRTKRPWYPQPSLKSCQLIKFPRF